MATVKNTLVLAAACVFAALALIAPATAAAAPIKEGTPPIELRKTQPAQALIGTQQEVELTASNPVGPKRGYNLSFRDVLPKGIVYVPGSASVAPIVIGNPTQESTTLIFENVSDLSVKSEYTLGFKVEPLAAIFQITGEHVWEDDAEAFVTEKARRKPTFEPDGKVKAGSFTGRATREAHTELTAVEIVKSEPSPEGEILRGLHEHQRTYTLTVQNNEIGPTGDLEVEDLLPAGLEFLGCGKHDYTTDTKTNKGSIEEYPGSGPIDPGNAPTGAEEATKCPQHEPYWVATVKDPPGKPAGVYTQVKWKELPELQAGEKFELQYVAAIPILQNEVNWLDGRDPTPESLEQAANLDNNTGPETFDEEPLTNFTEVKGTYEGVGVADTDELTRTAEDLAIQKSVDPTAIEEEEESIWTLDVETSEYRYVNGLKIEDTLPNGLCPIGEKGYEKPDGTSVEKTAECELEAGVEPTYEIVGSSLTQQPAEYTSIKYLPNGKFELLWNESTFSALAQMVPSEHLILKFPTKTRTFYQENYGPTAPVLTKDSWINKVEIEGANFARCSPGNPICTAGQEAIYTKEEAGKAVKDFSAASQEAGAVNINKTVRENKGVPVPENCSGEYVEGKEKPLPLYAPGDVICWNLEVEFAAKLYAGEPVVTDFVPTDEEYISGSAIAVEAPEGKNSIKSTFDEAFEGEKESLRWTLGEAVKSGKQFFQWRFKTKVKKDPATQPEQISGNLMKFVYSNTIGATFPLRDRAEVERQEPKLSLEKQIVEVVGGTQFPKPPPEGKSTATAGGGQLVKYELEIENSGNLGAEETEVWDKLPEGIKCADATLPPQTAPQAAECSGGFIKWTGVVVPEDGVVKLPYDLEVPNDVDPGHTFINVADVTRYKSPTNTGEKFEYITEGNPNEALGEPNTEAIEDEAELKTTAASLKKEQNKPSATIGEVVTFTVTTTIPPNSKVFGAPAIKDELPSGFQLVGAPSATLDKKPLSEGLALVPLTNGAEVTFSGPYPATPSATAHTIVLTLEGRVRNVPANVQGVKIKNEGSFTFDTIKGKPVESPPSDHTETTVVEPHLVLFKRLLPKEPERGTRVAPGEPVEYETEVVNTGGSTAYEVSVHDTIPNGMEIAVPGTGTPEEEGKKLSWTVAEIAPGGHVSLVYTLKVKEPAPAASKFDNKVVATTQSQENVGGETRDVTTPGAAAAGYEAKADKEVQLIAATVSKSVTPGEGTIGSEMTYTLHMNLPAEIEFFNTTLVDQLPKGLNFVELETEGAPKCEFTSVGLKGTPCGTGVELPSGPGPGGTTLRGWYFAEKFAASPSTRELTVKFKAIVNQEATAAELINKLAGFYNEAEVVGPPPPLPVPETESTAFSEETNVSAVPFRVFQPKLKLTKAVSGGVGTGGKTAVPGGTLSYTLTVKNEGTWPAYDFNVEDHPTANLTDFVLGTVEGEAGTVTSSSTAPPAWHVEGPLPAGKELELHYTAKLVGSNELANGEAVENKAEVPTYFGLKPSERVPPFVVEYPALEAEQKLQVELPRLALEKTTGTTGHADGADADVGVGFPWRIVVGNTAANAAAKEASVVDTLPEDWSYVPNSATVNGTKAEPTVAPGKPVKLTWTVPALPANNPASTEILFEALPEVVATAVKNEAVVTAKDESGSSGPEGKHYEAKGSATATIVRPEFKIGKTPDGETALAGTEREYSIKVTNIGEGKASAPITVEDQLGSEQNYLEPEASKLPAGVTSVSVNPTGGKGPAQIIWSIASLEPGASTTIPVPIEIPSGVADGHTISDIAKVSSPQAPTVEQDPGSFLVEREADLEILKEADRQNVNGGEFINYTLTAINNGPSDASGVVVTDEILEGAEFENVAVKAGSLGNCNYDPATKTVTCAVPVLVSKAKADFEVEVKVETGRLTPIFNTAEITGNEEDREHANDKAEVETTIGGSADLLIRKSGPTQPVLLGSTFIYKLEVENEGPSNAEDVEVVDELPEEVEFVETTEPAGTSCAEVGGTLTCELGTLLPKTPVVVFEVTVKAGALSPAGAKTLNTAKVESITPDPETENDERSAEVEILPAADLAITKTAPATVEPNGELSYALQVENLGPSVAHHVKVTDPLPSGVEFVSASEGCSATAGVVTCEAPPAGELEVGGSVDFQITVHVPYALGGHGMVNTATVAADEADPHVENNSSTVTTDVGPAADLEITKTMGKAQAGEPLTYTLAVTDKGPSASSAVTVKDTLPAGTSFKSATPSQGTCSAAGQAVTCQLGPLASGGSAQVSITVEVAATATGSIRNVASVEGPEPDPDKSNNESAVEGPVDPPVATDPNLKVVKNVDTTSPEVGTPFLYHVEVSNMSGGEAKNVKVIDTLDGPVKVVSIETESGHCGAGGSTITCTIPSIPVGKKVNILYSVIAEAPGPLKNTVSAQAADGEKAAGNNRAVKSVQARAVQAKYTLSKTASRKVVAGGKKVGFTITLRNGFAAMTNAKICDRLPEALVFVKAPGARYVNGEACWTKAYVAAHKVLRLHLIARAVKGYKSLQARNVATASADNAGRRSAAAAVRIKPAFAGKPGGVAG